MSEGLHGSNVPQHEGRPKPQLLHLGTKHGAAIGHDSKINPYDSQGIRGYPTSKNSMKGRLDDDSERLARDRSRSADYYVRDANSRNTSRSRSRGTGDSGRSGPTFDRTETDHHRSRFSSEHGHSYIPSSETDYEDSRGGDFRRDRPSNGHYGPASERDYEQDTRRGDFRRDRSSGGHYGPAAERDYEEDSRGGFRRDRSSGGRSEPHFKRGGRERSPPRNEDEQEHRSRTFPLVATREWPPNFDKEGSAFVFHPASGMFHEETSDFFFDPKAKLYYGVKKNAYFRYDDTQDPPFVETQQVDPAQGTPLDPVAPSLLLPPTLGTAADKPKIVINLKTKKMKTPQATTTASEADSILPIVRTKVQKEQVANIEKWQGKQGELKTGSSSLPVATANTEIKRTAKGEPICVICQRKFATIEKLRLHEAKSDLHKSNLVKQQAAQEVADEHKRELDQTPSTEQYNNRAEKRRQLHGSYSEPTKVELVASEVVEDAPKVDSLGETNVGNQLLQKMGWQAGDALGGRKSNDDQNAKSANDLRKDWDRIEAIATKKRRIDG